MTPAIDLGSPLQRLFLRAWTTGGFADGVAASPHGRLAEHDLAVDPEVAVTAFGWRSTVEHLCGYCQLAVPGIFVELAPGRPREAISPLDALFVRAASPSFVARAIAEPRATLAEVGLPVTANVRTTCRSGWRARRCCLPAAKSRWP